MNYTTSMKNSLSEGRLREYSGRDSDMDHSDEDSHHTAADDDEDWASSRKSRKSKKSKSRNRTKTMFY
ncbi:hypothetical protein WUBG_12240 [Wuchereria bancrofti]|nr:hypothetical protein WUBG_12240 [Wuchereria bancrofti]